MFSLLPDEMIREIFSFSRKWSLKNNKRLVYIEKLYQLKQPQTILHGAKIDYCVTLPITSNSSYELLFSCWIDTREITFNVIYNTKPDDNYWRHDIYTPKPDGMYGRDFFIFWSRNPSLWRFN